MSNINTLPIIQTTASTYFIVSDRGLASRFAYSDLTKTLQSNALQGLQGTAGNVQGATGPQGVLGTQGVTGAGNQGTAGSVQGQTGIQGAYGLQGKDGNQGTTGLGVQGTAGSVQGATGTQGVTGSGNQGVTGAQGLLGNQGVTGTQGLLGNQGVTGVGNQGTAGSVQGATGSQGITGNQGTVGVQGSTSFTPSIISSNGYTSTGVSRTLVAKFSETYSVKDFGAVGDGVTDDTVAIQTLIDVLSTSTNGGTVLLPAGAYKITSNLTITWPLATSNQDAPQGRVTINGEGSSMSIIYDYRNDTVANATNSGAIVIDDSAGTGARFFTMDMGGFSIVKKTSATTITGNPLTYTLGTGVGIFMNTVPGTGWFHDIRLVGHYNAIKLKDCLGLAFSNIKIANANIGIFAYGTTFSEPTDMIFKDCSISACKAFAYMFVGGGPVKIEGGLLESNGVVSGSDQSIAGGIYHRQSAFLPNQLYVNGVYFENQRGQADIYIDVQSGTAAKAVNNITNCMFARPENSAAGIVGYATNMIYVNNSNSAGVAKIIVNVSGNGFKSFSPYVADASRKYVAINGSDITMNAPATTNLYTDPVETPTF
jgi:hypothetical protein